MSTKQAGFKYKKRGIDPLRWTEGDYRGRKNEYPPEKVTQALQRKITRE